MPSAISSVFVSMGCPLFSMTEWRPYRHTVRPVSGRGGTVAGRRNREDELAMADDWGPLGPLTGDWEGEGGLDTAFNHEKGDVIQTPYLEKLSFKPFGPVVNGKQTLFGLDYRTAMWRGDEENPFHTEVGYWLW